MQSSHIITYLMYFVTFLFISVLINSFDKKGMNVLDCAAGPLNKTPCNYSRFTVPPCVGQLILLWNFRKDILKFCLPDTL